MQDTLGGYISWARTHKSLFILSFDEDDHCDNNQIPTVIVGGGVNPGNYSETINHYSVLRTIEDGYGLTPLGASADASPILDIWAPPPGDQPPVAVGSSSCTGATCSFDGSNSHDPDGTIASYYWQFGDGASGVGATPTHTYAASGSYTVTLTVTDNQNATSAPWTGAVDVTAAPSSVSFEVRQRWWAR